MTGRCKASLSLLLAGWMLGLTGCGGDPGPSATTGEGVRPVVIQLNWYPEAEHGGVYAAQAAGLYRDAGLDVTIRPGGHATPVAADLESGRCQFAFANADDVVLYRQQGVQVVAVLAAMQMHPRCILVRADSGVESLSDLDGLTLQRQPGRPFLEFMRGQGLLENVQEVPYTGSVAALVTGKDVAIQAYSFAEPLLAQQQGVEVRPLMVSDLGWNPYSSVLMTTEALIEEDPDLVRKVVQATQAGWQRYLTDPDDANTQILEANRQGMTAEALRFGASQLPDLAMPDGAALDTVGRMSEQRWATLLNQMTELGLLQDKQLQPSDCYDARFLNP